MQVIKPTKIRRVVMFIDLAVTAKEGADYTAIGTVGTDDEADIYILKMVRGQWQWPDARKIIKNEILLQCPDEVGIEQTAFQAAAVQELRRDPDLIAIPIRGVKPHKDKFTRALPVAAKAEAGQLFIVKGAWDIAGLLAEFCDFPLGDHDDRVDAVSGAVQMLATGKVEVRWA